MEVNKYRRSDNGPEVGPDRLLIPARLCPFGVRSIAEML